MLDYYYFQILCLFLFSASFIFPAKSFSQYIISGYAYYIDNNAPVTNDKIYILTINSSLEANLIDSSEINSDGSYDLLTYYNDSVICCLGWGPIIPTEDHVTTYYPGTIDWQKSTPIYPPDNPSNINIGVTRITPSAVDGNATGMVTTLDENNNEVPLAGAIVVARQENQFISSALTNTQGNYSLDSLNNGTCTIFATKIGYNMDSSSIIVGNSPVHSSLKLKKSKIYKLSHSGLEKTGGTFYLSQNYPNPFNPATKIKFSIPIIPLSRGVDAVSGRGVSVTLTIYDILGREITTLFSSPLGRTGGATYEVTWDARNYASGIYFYTLKTNTFTQTKKMLMIK